MELLLKMLLEDAPQVTTAPVRVTQGTELYDEWFGASLAGCNRSLAYINQKATLDPRQSYALDGYPAQNVWIGPFLVEPNQMSRTPNPPKPSEAAARDAYELAMIENHLLGTP